MKRSTCLSSAATLGLLLALLTPATPPPALAQRVNPVADDAIRLTSIGGMIGTLRVPKRQFSSENFGESIWPLGDVNSDGLADWAVSRDRCDTLVAHPSTADLYMYPLEVLLFKGIRGGLPATESGVRLGPTEIGSRTRIIAAGDFDKDTHPDICLASRVHYDTSGGNPQGILPVHKVYVMWGNARGEYSIDDTTRLLCNYDEWTGIVGGAGVDMSGDGVDDLVLHSGGGISAGVIYPQPTLRIFRGHRGRRWGRDPGAERTAEWFWWSTPSYETKLSILDHDCDGAFDIAFTYNSNAWPNHISVLYGRRGALPDTSSYEQVYLNEVGSFAARLADVTGDGAPELVLNCGHQAVVRIYAGRPGQRLRDQFGSGNDGPIAGMGWWRRPWAEIWAPSRLDSRFGVSGYSGFFVFGDINGDKRDEIWLASYPILVGYRVGESVDSIVDFWVEAPGTDEPRVTRIGDVDGSGRTAIALYYDEAPAPQNPFPGGLRFFVSTADTQYRPSRRPLPHLDGERCTSAQASIAPDPAAHPAPASRCTVRRVDHTIVVDCCGHNGSAIEAVSLVDGSGATLASTSPDRACDVSVPLPAGVDRVFVVVTHAGGVSELFPVLAR